MLTDWLSERLGDRLAGGFDLLPLSSCLERHGNDLVLIFVKGRRTPAYVLKRSRDAEFGFKIDAEVRGLGRAATADGLGDLVPRVVADGTTDGARWVIQEGRDGTPLSRRIVEARESDCERLLEVGLDVALTVRDVAATTGADWTTDRNSLATPTAGLESGAVADLGAEARRRILGWADRFADAKPSLVHGDLWQTNVLVGDDDRPTGLIDWEFALPGSGCPHDLAWCLVNAGYCLGLRRGRSLEESFETMFFEEGPERDLLARLAGRVGARCGLDHEDWSGAVALTLLAMSRREALAYGRAGAIDGACGRMLGLLMTRRDVFLGGA